MNGYQLTRLDLPKLDAETLQRYLEMTDARSRSCLYSRHPDDISNVTIIAVAIQTAGKPIGLALATVFNALRTAEVHSLFIEPQHRHKGLGSQLFNFLENEILKCRCILASFVYLKGEEYTPFLEKILKKQNWAGPRFYAMHFRFNSDTFHPPWLREDYKLPPSFTEFSWADLTQPEQQKLAFQLEHRVFSYGVSPLIEDAEMLNSLGLRYKGEVVGWMITKREKPDTIRYMALYIQKEFHGLGPAMKLLCDSILLQCKAGILYGVVEINIENSHPLWIKFAKRRLIPYAEKMTYQRQCWKELLN